MLLVAAAPAQLDRGPSREQGFILLLTLQTHTDEGWIQGNADSET